jgi:Ca2+-binding EF-hand superfamily protein
MRLLLLPALILVAAPAFAQEAIGDGPITRAQVDGAVRRQFRAMDADRNGTISRAEFEAYRARTGEGTPGDPFGHVGHHWFERADTNGDGKVTLAEAAARPNQLFNMADLNHDGVVSPSERQMASMLMGVKGR